MHVVRQRATLSEKVLDEPQFLSREKLLLVFFIDVEMGAGRLDKVSGRTIWRKAF